MDDYFPGFISFRYLKSGKPGTANLIRIIASFKKGIYVYGVAEIPIAGLLIVLINPSMMKNADLWDSKQAARLTKSCV